MIRTLELKPSILILGASGGVGQAVLQLLVHKRDTFSNVVLIDKSDSIMKSPFIDHEKLSAVFIQVEFAAGTLESLFRDIKQKYNISIVLDVTDFETLPVLSAADATGLSYLNCSLNSDTSSMHSFVDSMQSFSKRFTNNTHILSMGMNPGIANHLIVKGVLEHGIPTEYVEVEYDSGIPVNDPGLPFITWSKKQFLTEAVWDPAGYCGDNGNYIEFDTQAIHHLIDTEKYIKPIRKLDKYPKGMIVSHDEIIAMSHILEVPGKFVYAIHPLSLSRLTHLTETKKTVGESDIMYADNVNLPLTGSDFISVWLLYPHKDVCYYVDVNHENISGTNATLFMVAVGVVAGLLEFLHNPLLEKGVSSVFDLNNENFLKIVSEYMEIKVFERTKARKTFIQGLLKRGRQS